jgi:hypothetical protein
MNPATDYDLFISYGRKDDEEFVRQLYAGLTKNNYKVWYDNSGSLESNGLSFLQNIRDALSENPIRLIIVIGPHAAQSLYVKAEWEFALENCQVIIPILRMGLTKNENGKIIKSDKDYNLIPEPIQKRNLDCIDFRKERNYNEALDELLNDLSKDIKKLTELHGVINKPNNYINRNEDIDKIKKSILRDTREPTVVTSTGKATAVQGMGGIGKSVIAAAICHDCDIRRSFQDGIYWVTFGQQPDLQNALHYITKDNSIDIKNKLTEAKDKLKAFLNTKNCLIVLDDVWNQEHIEIFPSDIAFRCRFLITTRNKQTVKHLSKEIVEIGLLDIETALLLLSKASNTNNEELPDEAPNMIKECGYLPLVINMIGGMIKAGGKNSWKYSLQMLQEADLEEISQKFPDYPYPDLFKAIDVSINALNNNDRDKYLQLGVFKEDVRIPEEIIHILWQTENWKEYKTNRLLSDFVERGILLRVDNGIYMLHDLQLDYMRKTSKTIETVHKQLINNLGNPLKLPNLYAWSNYIWHLKEAGEIERATKLLQDFDWIDGKLRATGNLYEVTKDYDLLLAGEEIRLIQKALLLSAAVIADDPAQLPHQLFGRLGHWTMYYADKFQNRRLMLYAKKKSH